jgi:hypothetical protein
MRMEPVAGFGWPTGQYAVAWGKSGWQRCVSLEEARTLALSHVQAPGDHAVLYAVYQYGLDPLFAWEWRLGAARLYLDKGVAA